MTLVELKERAEENPYLYLTLPRRSLPRGDRTRLLGRSGPFGRICTVKEADKGYQVVAVFESKKILEFLSQEEVSPSA